MATRTAHTNTPSRHYFPSFSALFFIRSRIEEGDAKLSLVESEVSEAEKEIKTLKLQQQVGLLRYCSDGYRIERFDISCRIEVFGISYRKLRDIV